jgi:hypothetical protein
MPRIDVLAVVLNSAFRVYIIRVQGVLLDHALFGIRRRRAVRITFESRERFKQTTPDPDRIGLPPP